MSILKVHPLADAYRTRQALTQQRLPGDKPLTGWENSRIRLLILFRMAARTPPPRGADGEASGPSGRRGRPSNEHLRLRFATNLSRLLDEQRDLPRGIAARATALAGICGVTPAAARKWLTGAGWPTLEKLLVLAQRYRFAPEDLLFASPRTIDLTRLVDERSVRRAELAELQPLPDLDRPYSPLAIAINPRVLAGLEPDPDAPREPAHVLVHVSDDAMAPWCLRGDLLVVSLCDIEDPTGPIALRMTLAAPVVLRWVSQVREGFRLDGLSTDAGISPVLVPRLARDEAEALSGVPMVLGRPCWLLRNLNTPRR